MTMTLTFLCPEPWEDLRQEGGEDLGSAIRNPSQRMLTWAIGHF